MEIYNYVEHTQSPGPHDPVLLERVKFFIPDPVMDHVVEFLGDLVGQAPPTWKVDDFALKPVRRKRRDEWDDDEEGEDETPADPGTENWSRLMAEFVGYLRRVEGIPYPKGELIRHELFRYFSKRREGDLNPRLSRLEEAMNPKKRLPPPPKPSHPLCPERVTFEVYLSVFFGFMNMQYHIASALFEVVPAWLRFLESRGLIDARQHAKTLEEVRPLHPDLLPLMKKYHDDPALCRALQAWPAAAFK